LSSIAITKVRRPYFPAILLVSLVSSANSQIHDFVVVVFIIDNHDGSRRSFEASSFG
jgi:hypothetical protein